MQTSETASNAAARLCQNGHSYMCATEEAFTEQRALYGPTGRMEAVGPVDKGTLNAHAHDKAVISRLWEVSEKAVGFEWEL